MKMIAILFLYFFYCIVPAIAENTVLKNISQKELEFNTPQINHEILNDRCHIFDFKREDLPLSTISIRLTTMGEYLDGLNPAYPSLLADLFDTAGTKDKPGVTFYEELEKSGIEFSVVLDNSALTLKMHFLSNQGDHAVELLSKLIQNLAINEKNMADSKKRVIERIKKRNERFESIAVRKFNELFLGGFQVGKPLNIYNVENANLNELKSFHDRAIQGKVDLLLEGNYDRNSILQKLSFLTKSNPKSIPFLKREEVTTSAIKNRLKSFDKSGLKIHISGKNQIFLILGLALPPFHPTEYYQLELINYILGGGGFNSRLLERLRNDKGLVYYGYSAILYDRGYSLLKISTQTKTESFKEVVSIIENIFSAETIDRITEKEWEDAKKSLINQYVFWFETPSEILDLNYYYRKIQFPQDFLKNYRQNVNQADLKKAKITAKKLINAKNMKLVISGGNPDWEQKNLQDILPEGPIPIQ